MAAARGQVLMGDGTDPTVAWNLEPRPGVNYTRRSSVTKQGRFLVPPLRRTSSGAQACRGEARLLDSVVQYGRNKAEELLVFDVAGQTLALPLSLMAYHVVAQGGKESALPGEETPWMVTFCSTSGSGLGFVPVFELTPGETTVLKFGAAGIANGKPFLRDEQTNSHWDHVSGECFEGRLRGHKLESFNVRLLNVKGALNFYPDARLLGVGLGLSSVGKPASMAQVLSRKLNGLFGRKYLEDQRQNVPKRSVSRTFSFDVDPRLPLLSQGIGVVFDKSGRRTKYYPASEVPKRGKLVDTIRIMGMKGGGDKLEVFYGEDGGLKARYQKTGKEPIQVPARWYGWYFTYPETDVYAYKEPVAVNFSFTGKMKRRSESTPEPRRPGGLHQLRL